ncbi:MAG: hypothetical protein ABUL41_01365 [Chitinophagaceae bacterium]
MSNKHSEKYITKLLLGFSLTTAGIILIMFAAFERTKKEDWYFWGIVASLIINGGLYFMLNAFVHKVKSDLINRQKIRDQQKSAKTLEEPVP